MVFGSSELEGVHERKMVSRVFPETSSAPTRS